MRKSGQPLRTVASRADIELLADLRDAAYFFIDHPGEPVDAGFVRAVDATVIALTEIPRVCSLKFLTCEQQTHLAVSVSRRADPMIPAGKLARNESGRLERRDGRGQAWGIASSRLSSTGP